MKIWNLKIAIGSVLLLMPMACMHLGDGHHSGDHRSSTLQPSQPSMSNGFENRVIWAVDLSQEGGFSNGNMSQVPNKRSKFPHFL